MHYFTTKVNLIHEKEFCTATTRQQATWFKLLCVCAKEENQGEITHCRKWTDREWLILCGATTEEIEDQGTHNLFWWNAENPQNLIVWGYPATDEEKTREWRLKADKLKENGRKGGRPKNQTKTKQ